MIREALLAVLLLAAPCPAGAGESPHTVLDMLGRAVAVPARVERVACLEVLCYQKMFMLGAADRVTEMTDTAAPWMRLTNPRVDAIPKIPVAVNFEDLLKQRVDVAFFAYHQEQTTARLASLGIAGLVSQPDGKAVATAEGYVASYLRSVRMVGEVLGGDAPQRAEAWCAWTEERLRRITAIVRTIPPERRRKLYYLRGPDALQTQGPGSATFWFGILAGAEMVVRDQSWQGRGQVSMEDMIRWNPDVILVGRQYSPDLVLRDPRWADIAAVRGRQVYVTPEGVFYWDGGMESILLLEFIAKLLYPDDFQDIDMIAELRDFYRRFYRYPLGEAEARLLLAGRSPDGSRSNPMNN